MMTFNPMMKYINGIPWEKKIRIFEELEFQEF
jgi:hypothetical protein